MGKLNIVWSAKLMISSTDIVSILNTDVYTHRKLLLLALIWQDFFQGMLVNIDSWLYMALINIDECSLIFEYL